MRTLMRLAKKETTKICGLQKRAQYKAALGRGCAWYADPSTYHGRYHSRLHASDEITNQEIYATF